MGATTPDAFPFPEPSNPPLGPAQIQALAEAVQDFADIVPKDLLSPWITYTPIMTMSGGTGFNPSGSRPSGHYKRIGPLVIFSWGYKWADSGGNVGSGGFYRWSLPVPALADPSISGQIVDRPIGLGLIFGGNQVFSGGLFRDTATTMLMQVTGAPQVSPTAPIANGVGLIYRGMGAYSAA